MLQDFADIISSYTFNLQLFVSALSLVAVLNESCRSRRQFGIAVLHVAGVFAALYLVSFAVFCILAQTIVSSMWQSFATFAVFALYTVFFTRGDVKIRAVLSFTLFTILLIGTEVGGVMSFLLFDVFSSQAVRAIYLPVSLVYVVVVKCFDLHKYDTILAPLFIVDIFFNIVAAVMALMNSYINMNGSVPTWFNAVVMYTMLCTDFVVYLLCYFVARTTHTNLMLYVENNFSKTNAYTLELLQKKSEDLRCIRHDIRNQFAYMSMLLETDKYEELKKYFGTLDYNFSSSADSYIETGNLVMNSVFNMMAQKAAAQGISIECNAAVPAQLPFSDVDLCSLLSNLVDNAIESCVRQKIEGASVEVMTAVRGQSLYICVKNPVAEGTNIGRSLKLRTEKSEAGHGLGTKIVRRIACKYGGGHNYTFSVINGKFTAEVLLYYPTQKETADE